MQEEVFTQCPFCFEEISILVDPSVDDQTYIEDCQVCCRPIQFHVHCEEGEFVSISADRAS